MAFKTYASFNGGAGASAIQASPVKGPKGGGGSQGGWHPTVVYMLALVAAEIIAVGFLSRHLLK